VESDARTNAKEHARAVPPAELADAAERDAKHARKHAAVLEAALVNDSRE
jgi:hypothetical protein